MGDLVKPPPPGRGFFLPSSSLSFNLVLDGVVFHLVVVFGVPDLLEGLAEPDLLNAGGLALFAAPVVVIVALEVLFLIVQVHLGTAFSADYCFHILSFLPVQPIGQLCPAARETLSLDLTPEPLCRI